MMTTTILGRNMRDQHIQSLRDFGCAEELVVLLTEMSPETPVFAYQSGGEGLFYLVTGSADSEGAVYIDRKRMHIALDPEDARRVVALTGAHVEENNPTTWRVRVTPELALNPAARPHLRAAAERSLVRSTTRPRRDAADDGRRGVDVRQPSCGVCGIELPATRICDDHGRQ
jgi:hypothetical protein